MSRRNDDLIVKYPILLSEALSGLSIVFEHPSHEKIVIEYDNIIRHDSRFKIEGKGFYNRNSKKYGDLIFLFDIIFPNELNKQRKELIRKILPRRKKENDTNLSCYKLQKTNIDISPPNMREEYEDINQNECVQQ
jgi:DnaJ-class molecular chaperone